MFSEAQREFKRAKRRRNRQHIREVAAAAATVEGDWAEFGVRTGKGARHLLELMPADRKLHLFDSWKGLPEEWNRKPVGSFACDRPDLGDDRCVYWEGWFEDTLPGFLATHPDQIALAHIDCDIYSATATVLRELRDLFRPGTVLVFCALKGYRKWREGMWKAWTEWSVGMPHHWLGETDTGQAAVILL